MKLMLPPAPKEVVVDYYVDQAFKAGKRMIQTHLKDDILRFVRIAQMIQAEGYHLIWIKRRGCVGATKMEAPHGGN